MNNYQNALIAFEALTLEEKQKFFRNARIVPRVLSLAVIRKIDQGDSFFLLNQGFDKLKNRYFYRPLGGGTDFSENTEETVIRELKEEIDSNIIVEKNLGCLENIFTFEDVLGHEIIFVYLAKFADKSLYQKEYFDVQDTTVESSTAAWKSLSEIHAEGASLFPDGLENLLKNME